MTDRRRALEAIIDICDGGAYSNLRMKQALNGLDAKSASFVCALVRTCIENVSFIDHVIITLYPKKLHPKLRSIIRLGTTELLFMYSTDYGACSSYVNLAKEVGKAALTGVVNGVLREVCRKKDELMASLGDSPSDLSTKYGFPEWLVLEYIEAYGLEFTKELLAFTKPGLCLRPQAPYTIGDLTRALDELKVGFMRGELPCVHIQRGFDPSKSELFLNGLVAVQSESAMRVCEMCAVAPNMRVLDACAAPGGKSAYIASSVGNQCRIDAWDVHPHRVELIEKTLERLHVTCVSPLVKDASVYDKAFDLLYDVVLIDAPCSGFGVYKKPDARKNKSIEDITALAELQLSILSTCAKYVKHGGALIYSTCTISRLENSGVIKSFLSANSDFGNSSVVELFPNVHNTEGFFIVRMTRT